MLNYDRLPNPDYRRSFEDYFQRGVPLGGFLTAVMENDLREACARADDNNRRLLFAWVKWIYNEAPAAAWGDKKKVAAWIKQGGLEGK